MNAREQKLVMLAAPIAVAALAAACSLTTALDGLSNGAGVAVDAGTDSPVAAGDAATDGAIGDGGADGAILSFVCADHKQAVFCADFETDPLDLGFTSTDLGGGGSLLARAGKHGRALEARIPVHGAAERPSAALLKVLSLPAATSFTLSYDVHVEPTAGTGTLDYGGFHFNGPFYTAMLRSVEDGTVYLHEYADPSAGEPALNRNRPLARGSLPGVWTHVTMRVTYAAASSSMRLTFDDEVMLDGIPIDAYRYAGVPKVPVGLFNAESGGRAVGLLVDDVLVTTP